MSATILDNVAIGVTADIATSGAGPQVGCTAGSADIKDGADIIKSLASGEWTNLRPFAGGTSLTIEATSAGTTVKRIG